MRPPAIIFSVVFCVVLYYVALGNTGLVKWRLHTTNPTTTAKSRGRKGQQPVSMDSESLTAVITAHFERIEMAAAESAQEDVQEAEERAAPPMIIDDGSAQQEADGSGGVSHPLDKPHRYRLQDEFHDEDLYWQDDVRSDHFGNTLETGILYRPQIVAELHQMVEGALSRKVQQGIMVKGPGGIGKSYSLVNLVRKLIYGSNSKYLVTFIPDCFQWGSVVDLMRAICASCGIAVEPIRQQLKGNSVLDSILLDDLITSVDAILLKLGKKWVFVFDQINKLFVKAENMHAKDAAGLVFPFNYIQLVMKPRRITSVISASVNNEMAYKETHEGFLEYFHNPAMTESELLLLNDDINVSNVSTVVAETWGVPLFTATFVEKKMDADAYEAEVIGSVRHSLQKLKDETRYWDAIVLSTVSSLLYLGTDEDRYDKKFLLPERLQSLRRRYRPLVRQVFAAYRSFMWSELMTYVAAKERTLLALCKDPATTNKVRGCHFETMVIRRCSSSNVDILVGASSITVPSGDRAATGYSGMLLPEFPMEDGLYYPFDPNFPAIDFFLKSGNYIFAIQVHVSTHDDVANDFVGLCRKAGWFQRFDCIQLIYLSPEDDVAGLVTSLVSPPTLDAVATRQDGDTSVCKITRRAMSKDSISCLRDLQWPDGCSLNSS